MKELLDLLILIHGRIDKNEFPYTHQYSEDVKQKIIDHVYKLELEQIALLESIEALKNAINKSNEKYNGRGVSTIKIPNVNNRSYIEDLNEPNGDYTHTCSICQIQFQGHKKRLHCKTCDAKLT